MVAREKVDDGEDSGSGRFPIDLTGIVRRTESSPGQSFGELSTFFPVYWHAADPMLESRVRF